MVSVTVAVTPDLKQEMERYQDVNWSAVARDAIQRKLLVLQRMDELLKDSTLTEKDALSLGRKVNAAMARHPRASRR